MAITMKWTGCVILIAFMLPTIGGASSNWDRMSWDWDNWFEVLFTQSEVDQIVADAVTVAEAARDVVIAERDDVIRNQDTVIDRLNDTVLAFPHAAQSLWNTMTWTDDKWFIEFESVLSSAELRQEVSDFRNMNDQTGYILVNLVDVVTNEDEAVDLAIVDKDGDGLTDQQELDRGRDPTQYDITLTSGWNLLSVARIPDNNTIGNMLGNTISGVVWVWDATKFVTTDELLPSRGHWVFSGSDSSVPVDLEASNP